MAAEWPEPTADDVTVFMSSVVTQHAEQADGDIDSILSKVVQRIRGAIMGGHISPVSQNPTGIPPEGVQHALVLTVAALLSSAPTFDFAVKGEFGKMIERAETWIEEISGGKGVTRPSLILEGSDPDPVRYGSDSDAVDMTTD